MAYKFSTLKKQFLCCYPISLIDWKEIYNLSWDEQEVLLQQTVLCNENQKHSIKHSYQVDFLKKIIQNLEKTNSDIHDAIYETFCSLQSLSTRTVEKFAYKHYLLPQYGTTITLKESSSFVVDGTTGLCSWQAALALSNYLLQNQSILKDKTVLELGCGTGLCGFIISKCCNVSKIVLSDGSVNVVGLLEKNLKSNFKLNLKIEGQHYKLFDTDNGEIGIWHLPWQDIEEHKIEKVILPDVILASDVIYDSEILPVLVNTIDVLFKKRNNSSIMYLGATIRNENTFLKFLEFLNNSKFEYEKIQRLSCNDTLFWDTTTPVEIIVISRKK